MTYSNSFDIFDIIGPIMIGPSSSHTAGAVRIGLVAGQLCDYKPKEITVLFHGSLASTYSFHKTDVAVVAGVTGMKVDDERIRDSIDIARKGGIKVNVDKVNLENAHPSTIIIEILDQNGKKQVLRSATIGGGNIYIEEVNGYRVDTDGKQDCIVGLTTQKRPEFEMQLSGIDEKLEIVCFADQGECYSFKLEKASPMDGRMLQKVRDLPGTKEAFLFKAVMALTEKGKSFFRTCEELVAKSKENNCRISDVVIAFDAEKSGKTEAEVFEYMKQNYVAMRDSIQKGLEKENDLLGNIFKGNAAKMDRFAKSGRSICGVTVTEIVKNALAVMEVNGSMGKIVACPTAGSAGTVPAAVITVAEKNSVPEEKVVRALFTGAGIGVIIAENASISGAVGGCQAECGSASAMAAAIITDMFDGDSDQVLSAVSLALGNVLGMVCDPVAGMVEIPCIQRNTIAAVNAIICAEMALAGVDSVIPADEMIGALKEVGDLMHVSLKDTLGAGISNTPTARKIEERFFGKRD